MLIMSVYIYIYIYGHNGLQKHTLSKQQGGVQWRVAQKQKQLVPHHFIKNKSQKFL